MHVIIIKRNNEKELENEINKIIKSLDDVSPIERNYTNIKDIKFTQNETDFTAMIIFDKEF